MTNTQKETGNGSRNYVWLLHIALWAVLFGMPFFSPRPGNPLHGGGLNYSRFVPVLVSFFIVFYVNYFLLIKKYLFTRKFWHFILWNILLIALVSIMVHLVFEFLYPVPEMRPTRPPRTFLNQLNLITRNSVIYLGIICVAVAIRMTGRWYQDENKRREIEKITAETELANLKSQINPHFLFNTLNNIYSLISIDQGQAQDAVHDLSGMMRYLLYESEQPTVSLSNESKFLNEYVKLMSLRLPEDRVKLDVSLPEDSQKHIAPMLFIPLVENAFKHGISDTEDSFVKIDIHEDGDGVVCCVENSCFPKDDHDRSGSGIGLRNLSRRLEMLYPESHSFEYGNDGDIYRSTLIIKTL